MEFFERYRDQVARRHGGQTDGTIFRGLTRTLNRDGEAIGLEEVVRQAAHHVGPALIGRPRLRPQAAGIVIDAAFDRRTGLALAHATSSALYADLSVRRYMLYPSRTEGWASVASPVGLHLSAGGMGRLLDRIAGKRGHRAAQYEVEQVTALSMAFLERSYKMPAEKRDMHSLLWPHEEGVVRGRLARCDAKGIVLDWDGFRHAEEFGEREKGMLSILRDATRRNKTLLPIESFLARTREDRVIEAAERKARSAGAVRLRRARGRERDTASR